MKASPVDPLEKGLGLWEEACLSLYIQGHLPPQMIYPRKVPLEGPIVHAPHFREYLRTSFLQPRFDRDRFIGSPKVQEIMGVLGRSVVFLPEAMKDWTDTSRRIYRVTPELTRLLTLTSLRGVKWKDVFWRFESFGLEFEEPIVTHGRPPFNFILISREALLEGEPKVRAARLFSTDFNSYEPVTPFDRERVRRAIEKKNYPFLINFVNARSKRKHRSAVSYSFDGDPNKLVEDAAKGDVLDIQRSRDAQETTFTPLGANYPDMSIALRLVVGMCNYLQHLKNVRDGDRVISSWQKAKASGSVANGLTLDADVCSVGSIVKFSPEDIEALDAVRAIMTGTRAPYQLPFHFREGTYRRLPGHGHDPDAPQCVHQSPAIVRIDRRPEGSLPLGMRKILT